MDDYDVTLLAQCDTVVSGVVVQAVEGWGYVPEIVATLHGLAE